MKKMNRLLMACCMLLAGVCAGTQAQAQTTTRAQAQARTQAQTQAPIELKAFEDAAGNGSVLFRGKQATVYERPANGNPYWASSTFSPGEIIYEGNLYDDVLVNIDAVAGLALVRKGDNPVAVALRPESVSSIVAGDRLFVGIGDDGPEGLSRGFYEVFGEGPERVYKHVSKRLLASSQNMNGDPIGYYDPNYNSEMNNFYGITKSYYFMDREGRVSRFRSKGQLRGKFPERRKEIRKAISAAGMDMPGVDFDTYCKELLKIAAQ
jgi:hypothetical protein